MKLWLLGFVVLAVVGVAAVSLVRMNAAGSKEAPTTATSPTSTSRFALSPSPTPSASPLPSPTPYPAALAEETVRTYWDAISTGQVARAYDLLSRGAKAGTSRGEFVRNVTHLLDVTRGVTARVGTATVLGATAGVPVTLTFTTGGNTSTTQHLLWEDAWRIEQAAAAPTPAPKY